MNRTKVFKISVISCALTAAWQSPLAAEGPSDEVKALSQPESVISVGVGNWSKDRYQFGKYDGMRDSKAYGFLDLDLVKRDGATGTWMNLSGRNLGQDSRELSAEWLRQGDIGVSLGYSRLTRDDPMSFNTGLQGIGQVYQTISGAAGANALPKREVSLSTTRDLVELGFYKNISDALDLRISFKNEKKEGARIAGQGANAYFMTEPIDATTRQLEAILGYAGERLQVSGGYSGSWYENSNALMVGVIRGGAATSLSLPMDNQAHRLFVDAGYTFTPTTRGTIKLSSGTATQNETLPFASDWTRWAGSPERLGGKVNTTTAEVGLSSRPLPRLSLNANLRYHDVNDKTPVVRFTNQTNGYYTAHGYRTKSGKLEGTYRLPDGYSLTAGVDYKDQNRTAPRNGNMAAITQIEAPFRQNIDETTYRLQLRRAFSETINGSVAYLRGKRTGSGDVTTTAAGVEAAINPSHISDRKRDKWRGILDWSPSESLALQFTVEDSRDKYDFRPALGTGASDVPQGLKDGSANLFAADANYTLNDNWQLNAYYSLDITKSKLLGADDTAARNQKVTNFKETGHALGFGAKGQVSKDFRLGANLELVGSVTKTDQQVRTVTPLDDISNRMARLKLFAEYQMEKNSSLRFDLIHELWRTDDWTWTFNDRSPYVFNGLPTAIDGTTAILRQKQSSGFIGVRYNYKFQ
jgi:MtrB/PioB family decaheme-associated outer membrane protein